MADEGAWVRFALEITGGGGAYRVRVASTDPRVTNTNGEPFTLTPEELTALWSVQVSLVGQARDEARQAPPALPLDDATRQAWTTRGAVPAFELPPGARPLDAEGFSRRLRELVFPRGVRDSFVAAADRYRVAVSLNVLAPDLAGLPWEFLRDPQERATPYLAAASDRRFVRVNARSTGGARLDGPRPFVLAVAVDGPERGLEFGPEREKLQALKAKGRVDLLWLEGEQATYPNVHRALRENPVRIFHFAGHGRFDATGGGGAVVLQDGPVDAERLATLLGGSGVRVAFLNSCQGATSARADAFAGAAQSLAAVGVPAVLAMQHVVLDGLAGEFAAEFYERLAEGDDVSTAINTVRGKFRGPSVPKDAWATPVLYLNVDEERPLAESPRGLAPPDLPAMREALRGLRADGGAGDGAPRGAAALRVEVPTGLGALQLGELLTSAGFGGAEVRAATRGGASRRVDRRHAETLTSLARARAEAESMMAKAEAEASAIQKEIDGISHEPEPRVPADHEAWSGRRQSLPALEIRKADRQRARDEQQRAASSVEAEVRAVEAAYLRDCAEAEDEDLLAFARDFFAHARSTSVERRDPLAGFELALASSRLCELAEAAANRPVTAAEVRRSFDGAVPPTIEAGPLRRDLLAIGAGALRAVVALGGVAQADANHRKEHADLRGRLPLESVANRTREMADGLKWPWPTPPDGRGLERPGEIAARADALEKTLGWARDRVAGLRALLAEPAGLRDALDAGLRQAATLAQRMGRLRGESCGLLGDVLVLDRLVRFGADDARLPACARDLCVALRDEAARRLGAGAGDVARGIVASDYGLGDLDGTAALLRDYGAAYERLPRCIADGERCAQAHRDSLRALGEQPLRAIEGVGGRLRWATWMSLIPVVGVLTLCGSRRKIDVLIEWIVDGRGEVRVSAANTCAEVARGSKYAALVSGLLAFASAAGACAAARAGRGEVALGAAAATVAWVTSALLVARNWGLTRSA
ncbi:MAG: CHAT domain-containing protein [Polyangiales bacterium]